MTRLASQGTRWVGALAAFVAGALAAADGEARLVRDGVSVEFTLARPGEAGRPAAPLVEGDYAEVRFRMTDAASGRPVSGLRPAAWLDMAGAVGDKAGPQKDCKDRIALYLQGSVGIRPMVDLNSYYLLTMNADATVSVIDPVVSMTGNTSLFATIPLKRPARDWTRSRDEKRLYLSMPRAGQVAVVDAERFKVLADVAAGEEPHRVALQPDGRYLWVGNDAADPGRSGVTVIDTETLRMVKFIRTGRGHHELAFSADGRRAFVTNRADGTVSVIEVAKLAKVKDLATGPLPIGIATSSLSQAVYVADGKAGTVAVIEPGELEVVARIEAKPGLGPLRFTRDGRWAFAVNPAERSVFVLDAAENRIVHTLAMGGEPYQVVFTRAFAYVRLLDSEEVRMVNLLGLGAGKEPIVQKFGAGAGPPRDAGELAAADGIAPASGDAAVFVLNPVESTTYFYMEGMNAPMGSFGGYGHAVRAVAVVDRSLREVEPGVYAAKLRLPAAGRYDVAFLLDNPRVLHCFSAEARPNPAVAGDGRLTVDFLDLPPRAAVGAPVTVRVRLADAATRLPRAGLRDVTIAYHVSPGGPRATAAAREVGGGEYEATIRPHGPGACYLFVAVPSLGVKAADLPYRGLVVESTRPGTPPARGRGSP